MGGMLTGQHRLSAVERAKPPAPKRLRESTVRQVHATTARGSRALPACWWPPQWDVAEAMGDWIVRNQQETS